MKGATNVFVRNDCPRAVGMMREIQPGEKLATDPDYICLTYLCVMPLSCYLVNP